MGRCVLVVVVFVWEGGKYEIEKDEEVEEGIGSRLSIIFDIMNKVSLGVSRDRYLLMLLVCL